MSISLVVAPAGAGKTTFGVDIVRKVSSSGVHGLHVVVASKLQVSDWYERLAAAGGALGVSVQTFDGLCVDVLAAARETYVLLSDPVRYRLLRAVIDAEILQHYAPLRGFPGFVSSLQAQIDELEAARIGPEAIAQAAAGRPQERRLAEMAHVHASYRQRLTEQAWVDHAGLSGLAIRALENGAAIATDWPLLLVDGFDSFTQAQLEILAILARRAQQTVVTLTGGEAGNARPVFDRFKTTRLRLEAVVGASPSHTSPLPAHPPTKTTTLDHIFANFAGTARPRVENDGTLDMIACPDRATEVREALRWLKARVMSDGYEPRRCALLARSLSTYRPFVTQIAAEFEMPVRLVDGEPLATNPLISAILDLLRLALPSDDGRPTLARRSLIASWRCPYFNWLDVIDPLDNRALGITATDADALDVVARMGQVLTGLSQWQEAFQAFQAAPSAEDAEETNRANGHAAEPLRAKFDGFVRLITPPLAAGNFRQFVSWLEDLVGPDATDVTEDDWNDTSADSLQVMRQVRSAGRTGESAALVERDLTALSRLKEMLRGLVWAEEVVPCDEARTFEEFVAEVSGAVAAVTYSVPLAPSDRAVLAADVHQARGLSFDAVAVLGLAEGEFPAPISEDVLLDDADREWLRRDFGLAIDLSTESAETESFYETITRAARRLLLTRPRLTDTGVDWPPSPFWEEVLDLVQLQPLSLTTDSLPPAQVVASWPELMEHLSRPSHAPQLLDWTQSADPLRCSALFRARDVVVARGADEAATPFDGDLSALAPRLGQWFGHGRQWSATQFETYHTCPFSFFVGRVLRLEPRIEPAEGIDVSTLGKIYHRILKQLFSSSEDPTDETRTLDALSAIAADVLDRAPQEDGFRCTAWWQHTRQEIETNIRDTLPALFKETAGFVPVATEVSFGDGHCLCLRREGDILRLRGIIDRVDRNRAGELLVIDYKTGGPSTFTFTSLYEGRHLQLPFYALAARDALGLGQPADGFFWHIRQAKPSPLRLARHEGGVDGCAQVAIERVWQAVDAIRQGRFQPHVPGDGCPTYCPAAGICWHFRPGFGG